MNPDEILEALGLERRSADAAFLRDVFGAFNRAVPFETASKIVRDAGISVTAEKPRRPDVFWGDFLELGTGGTCFARAAGFERLTSALGFDPVLVLGGIMGQRNHASLLYSLGGRTWLADVGYPLPDLLPLETATFDTPVGSLDFSVSGRSAVLRFVSGPEAGRVIDFSFDPVGEDELRGSWERTFSKTSMFLREVILRKPDGHRLLRFFRGGVDVSDAHSRARIPLAGGRAERLSELFGIDSNLLGSAFSIAGDPDPERTSARVEAYGDPSGAETRFAELATPEGWRRFAAGLGSIEVEVVGDRRWRAVLRPESGDAVVEDVEVFPDQETIRVRRSGGLAETGFALDRKSGEPRLVRFAELPDAREEFLRVDAGRGRIAGILAMDLLAVSRM